MDLSSEIFNVERGIYSCPKKLISRKETIILPYREYISKSLPANKQYWSMSARCIDDNGQLIPNCEMDQMVKERLITPDQFHGVDMRSHLYQANIKSKVGGHWYNNDFRSAMVKEYNRGNFNPGIVNVDSLYMPNRGVVDFGNIMSFLSSIKGLNGVLLIGNFILRQRKVTCIPNSIFEDLKSILNITFKQCQWQSNFRVYTYNGSGTCKRTWMGSCIFYIL